MVLGMTLRMTSRMTLGMTLGMAFRASLGMRHTHHGNLLHAEGVPTHLLSQTPNDGMCGGGWGSPPFAEVLREMKACPPMQRQCGMRKHNCRRHYAKTMHASGRIVERAGELSP